MEKLRHRRVLIEVETSLAPGRDMVRGIAKFVREIRRWDLHHNAGRWALHDGASGPSRIGPLPAETDVDGIITRIYDEASELKALALMERGIPVVDVLGEETGARVPLVHTDDAAIAAMAVRHLREQGFRDFAFCGIASTRWSANRREAFQGAVAEPGQPLPAIELDQAGDTGAEVDIARVEAWLAGLPKPTGIFVSCDHIAPVLLKACAHLGITVPEQVSVVGVNNDTVACNVCSPTLSSIDANHFLIGYRAARRLEGMMDGEPPPGEPLLVPPRGLVVRGSSGEPMIEDALIARAVRFIDRNAASLGGVDDVAALLPVSRRELQRRFRHVTGRTVHSAIIDARLNIAKELLASTDYTVDAIAEMSGFGSRQHFAKTFRTHVGSTPAKFRDDPDRA